MPLAVMIRTRAGWTRAGWRSTRRDALALACAELLTGTATDAVLLAHGSPVDAIAMGPGGIARVRIPADFPTPLAA